jgi:hypothetical protein
MRTHRDVSALALIATLALSVPALAQPSRPTDIPEAVDRPEKPTSKSDAYRMVGKVLEIDQQKGVVKLQTEEGVVAAKPRPELVRAARVGDTISVPRPDNEQAPSASPQTTPRQRR